MVTLIKNNITIEEYLELREQVAWRKLSHNQAKKAISNSLFIVKAYDEDSKRLVGMGRIVGDGAVICYIQDLIVIPEAQGKHIGSMIIECLKEYVTDIREDNTTMMLCLMCAKGREPFYIKHGFTPRPTDNLGPGMITYLC
ncbi:MAG: GNAT family N-acetyltransferase [Lachnospiraceae bacterium]|nr:GNAT family N-acetyltransferase [Lachnospiraceae bacterium]